MNPGVTPSNANSFMSPGYESQESGKRNAVFLHTGWKFQQCLRSNPIFRYRGTRGIAG